MDWILQVGEDAEASAKSISVTYSANKVVCSCDSESSLCSPAYKEVAEYIKGCVDEPNERVVGKNRLRPSKLKGEVNWRSRRIQRCGRLPWVVVVNTDPNKI